MLGERPSFHYPQGLKVRNPPLVEAWLEIRWRLQQDSFQDGLKRDPQFAFALGKFRDRVAEHFPHLKTRDAIHVPEEMAPHVVRYQFWTASETYPLIQIGPGVATVNFGTYRKWEDFRQTANFMREHLVASYDKGYLQATSVALRYRDVEQFQYSDDDVFEFFRTNLNTSIDLPVHIPGVVGQRDCASAVDFRFSYDLHYPVGRGSIQLATGTRKSGSEDESDDKAAEVVVLQLEVVSSDENVPLVHDADQFNAWLESAHDVLHEWFFSFTEGPLWKKYGVIE